MPIIEALGKPIVTGNYQDENQKRKFLSRLWHLIAASLFLALVGGLAEVQLGKLAIEHAASPDVKQFGQRMVEDHDKANRELMAVVEPKGIAVPTALDRQHRQAADRLAKLHGPAFDRAYMQAMVKDHETDVKLFRTEAQQGQDPELKRWAANTLPTLEEHLTMARNLATSGR
jgi:putative membrane protein